MSEHARVLYVDDDPQYRERVESTLETNRATFSVETVTTAGAARDRLAETEYDCLVSAYELPEDDGLALLETVRDDHPAVPFVLFAAAGSETVASRAISAGVTDYLQKEPAAEQIEELTARIESLVGEGQPADPSGPQTAHFELAQQVVEMGAWELDLSTDEGWSTAGTSQLFGVPADQGLDPGSALERIHPDDRPTVELALHHAIQDGEPYDLEFRLQTDDGLRWVRCLCEPLVVGDEPVRLRGILVDLTERKHRQSVLKALHRVGTAVQTDQTAEQVCDRIVDAAIEILDFGACAAFIREGEWLVPYASSADSLADRSRPLQVDEGIAGKAYRTGESYLIDDATALEEAAPPSDTYRGGISIPIGDHGVFQGTTKEVGAYDERDLEFAELLLSHAESALDRIDREQELKRQNERLEEFANIVSHDLRNPLNVAQLRLHLVREEYEDDNLDSVAEAQDRMERLIENLLSLARAGNPVEETEPVSLSGVTRASWRNVETGDASLVTDLDGTIQANESRLQQLFENLIRNAVEHAPTDDTVTVTVGQIADEGFYFEDDGPGIPADEREDVFESGYTSLEDGTGFGLAIVEDVVEAHEWELRLTESDSGGARFEITSVSFTEEQDRSKNV